MAAGRLVVVGHSLDFGDSALPYLPFSEILGRLQDELPAVVDTVAQTYPAIMRLLPRQRVRVAQATLEGADAAEHASGADDRSSRSDLFAGIHALLEEAARTQPLLVVIEDAHWADQSSRELLSYLFARQLEAPVSLVVSYRSDDVHRRHPLRPTLAEWSRLPTLHRLQVGPLSEASVRTLVHALHPDPLTDEQVRAIISGPTATRSSSRSSAAWRASPAPRPSRSTSPTCSWSGWTGSTSRPVAWWAPRRWPGAGSPTSCWPGCSRPRGRTPRTSTSACARPWTP